MDERKLSGELLHQQFTQQKDAAEKMSAMLDSVEQERASIAGELRAARDECTVAIAEQTKLKCSSECLLDELKGNVGTLHAERSALQLQLDELAERLEVKCADVQRLTDAKAELTSKNEQLLQEQGCLKDSSQQLQASVDELRKSCDEASAQVVAMTTQLEEANREWVGKLERADDVLVAVREKLRVSDIENDSLKMELSVTGCEVQKRDGDRRAAEARVIELTAASDVLQQQAATEREAKERLVIEVQGLSSERDAMAGKLGSCEKELTDMREKQVDAGCKADSLVASLRERLSELEDEKASMKQEIEQAALKLDHGEETATVAARQLSQFKEQNEQLLQQIEDSKASVEQLKTALSCSEKEKHENATALEGVNTELTSIKSAQEKLLCESTGLIENLRRRQKETENEKAKVETELEGALAKLGYNEETAGTVTRDLSRCKEDNEQLFQRIKESKDVVEQLKSLVSTLEDKKSKATAEVDATKDELNSVKNAQEKSQCELTGLIDDLRERQKVEEDKRIALQAELQEVMVKLDDREENMASTVCELSRCRESNEQLLQQIQESKNVVEQLKSVNSTLEAENVKTAVELEAASEELSSVKVAQEKSLCESSGLIEELRKRERGMIDAKVASTRELDEAVVKINSNEEIASAVVQELSQCKEHNGRLLQQNGDMKDALERLEMKVTLSEKDGDEIAVELETVKVELAATRREQQAEQCQSSGLVEDLRQQGKAAEERVVSIQKELEEASVKLDNGQEVMTGVVQELEKAREREAVLLQQLEDGQQRLVAMETAIEEATGEKGALMARCDQLTLDLEAGRAGEAETTLKQDALIVELRRQVGVATAERDAARTDIDSALFKLENVTEDAECLSEQLESSSARHTQLEQRCDELKTSLGDVERRLEESEEGRRAELAAVEELQGKDESLRAELTARKAEEENVGTHVRQLEDDTQRRKGELIAARDEVDKLQVALTAEEACCSGLKQDKRDLENDLDAVTRRVVNLGEEKMEMSGSIERLEAAVAASLTDIDKLKQEVTRVEDTNVTQTRSFADQTHSAEMALSEARQRCDDLQTKLDIADIERREAEGSHAKKEADFETRTGQLQADIGSSQMENNSVLAQLKEAEFLLSTARQEGATLQSVTERNQLDMTILLETHQTEINHRENLQACLSDELRALRADLGGLEGDLARSKELVGDLEQQLSTTQEELLHSTGVQRSAENERYREAGELHKRITELEAVVVEKSRQVETLEGEIQTAKTSADCCEAELQVALQTQVGKIKEVELKLREAETLHLSETNSLVSEHAFKVATMQESIDTLQQDEEKHRSELQDRADQLQALRTEYSSELATAKRELDQSTSISQTTKEELGQLENQMVDVREALGRKDEELRAATDDSASVKAELNAKTEEMVQAKYVAETRLAEMEATCSKLDAQLRVAYDCGEETEQQLREETNEITVLKQQISSLEASVLELDAQKNEIKEESRALTVEKDGIVARNQRQWDDHKMAVSELEQQLYQARERADNSEIQTVTLRDSISALEKALSSDEDRHVRERADLASRMQQLENSVKEKQGEVDKIQAELDAAVATGDEQAIAEQGKSAELSCALREMERTGLEQTRQLETQLVELQGQMEFAADAAESEKTSLQIELTAVREQLHKTKDAIHAGDVKQAQATAELESEVRRLTAAVERLERQGVVSDELLSAAQLEGSARAEDLFTARERIKFLVEEATQAGRASQQELECAQEKLHQVETSLSDAQDKVASANEERLAFEQKLSEAVTVEAQLRQQVVSLEDSCSWTVENDTRLALVENLRQQIVDDCTRTESETSRLNITVHELQLKLAQVGEEATERDGRRCDMESCLAAAEKKLAAAKDEIVALEGKLSEAGTVEAQLRQQMSSLEATKEQMRMSAEEQDASQRDVTERFDRFMEQSNCDVSNLKQAAVALEKRCQQKQDSLVEMKEELAVQKDACNLIESNGAKRVKESKEEIDFLREELANAESESEEHLEHIQKLEGTLLNMETSSVMTTCDLQMQCQRLREKLCSLEAAASLQSDLEERGALLDVENDAVITEIAGLKEIILQMETDKKTALADISKLEEKICQLQDQLTGVEEQRDSALSDCTHATEDLKQVEDQLECALEQHVASLALATSECSDEQRSRIAMLEADNLQLADDLTDSRKSVTDVKAALTLAETDNLTVEGDLLALTKTRDIASVENSELRTKLLNADQQMSALSRDVDVAKARTCELLESVDCLQEEKKDLAEKLVSAERDKSAAVETLNMTETEMSTLRAEVESVRTDAREENAGLRNQLEVKQMECGALTDQLQEMQEQLCELGEQKSQLIEQLCELQSHLSEVSNEKDVVVGRCEAVEAEHRLLQDAFTQADVEQEELRSTVEELRSSVERLEQEKCDAERKVEETTELLQVIQMESEGLQEDVDEYRKTSRDDRVRLEALQAEKDAADVTAADNVDAVARRAAEMRALRKELKDMEVDWESKSREVDELGRTVARLEWDAKDGERETRRLEEMCSDARTAHEDCLAELDTARHQYTSAMERVDDLETSAARHADSVETLKAKVTATMAENNKLRQELVQLTADAMAEQTQVKQQLTDVQRDLETTRQDGVALEQQLLEQRAQSETKLALVDQEILRLTQDKEELDAQMETMVFEKTELELEKDELVSQAAALELEKAELVSRTGALELEKEELASQTRALELEKDELVSQTRTLELEKDELVSRATALELEKAELVSRTRALELENEELVSRATALELEKAELVSQTRALELEKEDLASQVTALRTTITQQLAQVKDLNIGHAEIMQELTQLKSKLKLLEQLSEEVLQLRSKVKLLEVAEEEVQRLRNSAEVLEHTQTELAVLMQEKNAACSEQLRLKEQVETSKVSYLMFTGNDTCLMAYPISQW